VFRGQLRPVWGLRQAAASSLPAHQKPVAISLAAIRWLEFGQADPSTGHAGMPESHSDHAERVSPGRRSVSGEQPEG